MLFDDFTFAQHVFHHGECLRRVTLGQHTQTGGAQAWVGVGQSQVHRFIETPIFQSGETVEALDADAGRAILVDDELQQRRSDFLDAEFGSDLRRFRADLVGTGEDATQGGAHRLRGDLLRTRC